MHDFVSKDFLIAKELAVSMSGSLDAELRAHFTHPGRQEDLTFAYWRPSVGDRRFTALLGTLALPTGAERLSTAMRHLRPTTWLAHWPPVHRDAVSLCCIPTSRVAGRT